MSDPDVPTGDKATIAKIRALLNAAEERHGRRVTFTRWLWFGTGLIVATISYVVIRVLW